MPVPGAFSRSSVRGRDRMSRLRRSTATRYLGGWTSVWRSPHPPSRIPCTAAWCGRMVDAWAARTYTLTLYSPVCSPGGPPCRVTPPRGRVRCRRAFRLDPRGARRGGARRPSLWQRRERVPEGGRRVRVRPDEHDERRRLRRRRLRVPGRPHLRPAGLRHRPSDPVQPAHDGVHAVLDDERCGLQDDGTLHLRTRGAGDERAVRDGVQLLRVLRALPRREHDGRGGGVRDQTREEPKSLGAPRPTPRRTRLPRRWTGPTKGWTGSSGGVDGTRTRGLRRDRPAL
jgi:hypothetical protein